MCYSRNVVELCETRDEGHVVRNEQMNVKVNLLIEFVFRVDLTIILLCLLHVCACIVISMHIHWIAPLKQYLAILIYKCRRIVALHVVHIAPQTPSNVRYLLYN